MDETPSYSFTGLMLSALMLIVAGWFGLYLLVNATEPHLGPRWLLYVLWTCACTGTSLPFLWLLNRRFRSRAPASPRILLREGLMVGLYGSICLWLQLNDMLNLTLALLLGIGLFAIEWLLRLIERNARNPR
jgi:hypothetical protein